MQLKSMTMSTGLAALALAALMTVTPAAAGNVTPSCEAQAAEQTLTGADKDSFIEKCLKDQAVKTGGAGVNPDRSPTCEAQAAEQELTGADKDSFIEKCLKDQAVKTGGGGVNPD